MLRSKFRNSSFFQILGAWNLHNPIFEAKYTHMFKQHITLSSILIKWSSHLLLPNDFFWFFHQPCHINCDTKHLNGAQ